jgi:hypothetical protein
MNKQTCKHGLTKQTCAYCTGLITRATPDAHASDVITGFLVIDERHGYRKARAAVRSAYFDSNPDKSTRG